jgi:multiple sugar transport system ATP-binding protein
MAGISLKDVTKSWGSFKGVDNIDLEIQDQEFMVFLGPSGCGKTTTMRMIAGLEDPTSGDVRIDGELMNDVDARDRDVAMVFQSYALYPNMTIRENIRFPLRMRGVPEAQHAAMVSKAAEMVELGDYLERKPAALSGGQRQRAALARAIVRQPKIFLMDEPLSNLDAKLRLTMRAQLKHIQRELKITTVYVTHDQIEAMTLADRVAVMNKGKIQQLGTPDEIYNTPNHLFVAGFIGSPPMNLIKGRLRNGDFEGDSIVVKGVGRGDLANIVLGIRPEDVSLTQAQGAQLTSTIYGLEPTGDMTLVMAKAGDQMIVAKGHRQFRAEIGAPVSFAFARDHVHLFDGTSGDRLASA